MPGPDPKVMIRETIALLDIDAIDRTISTIQADTPEKEAAIEYVQAYLQCLRDIAENDTGRRRIRADFEIRELIGHINAMLRQKYNDIFMKMVMKAPAHYKSLCSAISAQRPVAD